MTILRVDNTNWISGIKSAGEIYNLIGPVEDKEIGYKFKSLEVGETPILNFTSTILSPKGFIFPQSEEILTASLNESCDLDAYSVKEVNKEHKLNAVIGIRPCDAKANTILNINFDTSDVKDPYWVKAYQDTTFIALACDNPSNICFCTTAVSNPYGTDGADLIAFRNNNDGYYIKVITEKGSRFINSAGWKNLPVEQDIIFDNRKNIAEKRVSSNIQTDKLKGINLLDLYNANFWDNISFACINCGTCTFVCPTCWCFDIQDKIFKKACTRSKNWDSCMFPIFTLHTTGHNPRGTKKHKVRQRFMHKLKYYIDKYDNGIMCVGCGRCVRSCPVNIDIRKICNHMNSFESANICEV